MSEGLEKLAEILREKLPEAEVRAILAQLTIASGNGSVSIGGDAIDSVVVTGNNNRVTIDREADGETIRKIIQELLPIISQRPQYRDAEYFRTIEACNDRQALERYFETVLPRLRQQGALEIRQNVFKDGRLFNYISKITDFEPGWGMRGEAFFIFSEFSSMQIKILQQYSIQCLQMSQATANSSSVGEAVYNFRIPTSLCFAVAIVDRLDEDTITTIRTTNPIDTRVNALWYEIPVVCELSRQKTYFYEKAASFLDNFKGEIVWQGFRSIIQEVLSFRSGLK
jgi:hypothetical protein